MIIFRATLYRHNIDVIYRFSGRPTLSPNLLRRQFAYHASPIIVVSELSGIEAHASLSSACINDLRQR